MSITVTNTWEDLRRRARQLENDIDKRLLTLNKLGHNLGGPSRFASSSDQQPLINAEHSQFDDLSQQLDNALTQLNDVNDQMNALVQQSSSLQGSAAPQHMLRRHRDILRDYNYEYNRTKDNIARQLDRQELLSSKAPSSLQPQDGLNNRRNDPLLKENEHARSTDRLLDEQISIAMSTREHLSSQRLNLRGISKKLDTITKKYPAINSLMHKIQFKKRKDKVVIGIVISVCLILFFLWTFT